MAFPSQIISQTLRDLGYNAYPSFEELITVDEAQDNLPIIFIQANQIQSDIHYSSDGLIVSAGVAVYVFADNSLDAVTILDEIIKLGFTSPEGKLGDPKTAPFFIGTLKVYKWRPLGEIEQVAEKAGNIWLAEQGFLIDYTEITEND